LFIFYILELSYKDNESSDENNDSVLKILSKSSTATNKRKIEDEITIGMVNVLILS